MHAFAITSYEFMNHGVQAIIYAIDVSKVDIEINQFLCVKDIHDIEDLHFMVIR